jgi:hypothetical protein
MRAAAVAALAVLVACGDGRDEPSCSPAVAPAPATTTARAAIADELAVRTEDLARALALGERLRCDVIRGAYERPQPFPSEVARLAAATAAIPTTATPATTAAAAADAEAERVRDWLETLQTRWYPEVGSVPPEPGARWPHHTRVYLHDLEVAWCAHDLREGPSVRRGADSARAEVARLQAELDALDVATSTLILASSGCAP